MVEIHGVKIWNRQEEKSGAKIDVVCGIIAMKYVDGYKLRNSTQLKRIRWKNYVIRWSEGQGKRRR